MKPRDFLQTASSWTFVWLALVAAVPAQTPASAPDVGPLRDKTLVAWVALTNTTQRGGSFLAIENLPGQFDALVFGEIEPARWMAGSDSFRRTAREQASWPMETGGAGMLVHVAVTYQGKNVSLYRDGQPYARYTMELDPVSCNEWSIMLLGLRHWEILGSSTFLGEIEDAPIYPQALDAAVLGKLRPDQAEDPRPLAWWNQLTRMLIKDPELESTGGRREENVFLV